MVWTSTQPTARGVSSKFMPSLQGEDHATWPLCLHLLLPSKWFLSYYSHDSALHMFTSAHYNTRSHSLIKTVLGKIVDWYQAYCTTYKMHAMATCHWGAGCILNRGLDILLEDPEHTDIDSESTNSSDATVALGGPEAAGNPKYPVYGNWNRLTTLIREINTYTKE